MVSCRERGRRARDRAVDRLDPGGGEERGYLARGARRRRRSGLRRRATRPRPPRRSPTQRPTAASGGTTESTTSASRSSDASAPTSSSPASAASRRVRCAASRRARRSRAPRLLGAARRGRCPLRRPRRCRRPARTDGYHARPTSVRSRASSRRRSRRVARDRAARISAGCSTGLLVLPVLRLDDSSRRSRGEASTPPGTGLREGGPPLVRFRLRRARAPRVPRPGGRGPGRERACSAPPGSFRCRSRASGPSSTLRTRGLPWNSPPSVHVGRVRNEPSDSAGSYRPPYFSSFPKAPSARRSWRRGLRSQLLPG